MKDINAYDNSTQKCGLIKQIKLVEGLKSKMKPKKEKNPHEQIHKNIGVD